MLVDNSTAGSAVTGAIRQAAQATGTSFQYLLATAQVESGLNPKAGAATSSARGLFQFIDQTWLATMKQAGPSLGYGQYAAAITKTASGRYEVADPAMRSEILKLRNDPTVNAVMAGAFTQANAALLSERLGRSPSEGELYIAHFLGAGGAARLIAAAAANPNASAASYFPNAAHANASIFYDRTTGTPRSLAQVRNVLTARYDVAARLRPGDGNSAVQAAYAPNANSALPPILPLPIPSTSIPAAAIPAAAIPAAAIPAAAIPAAAIPTPATSTAATPAAATVTAATASTATAVAPAVPDTAGMTSAFAAAAPERAPQDNAMFHGLFSDPGRTGPVAEVVSQLWGVAGPASGANGTSTPSASAMLDLFKDNGERGT